MVNTTLSSQLRGFGLIELIVSISIITIVTGIVVARHNAFNGAILLRNQAYEVAFAIRQAQQMAVSGSDSFAANQRPRYGVYFNNDDANKDVYRLFRNDDSNYHFNSSNDTEIAVFRFDSRFELGSVTQNPLSITFTRPLYDATFSHNGTLLSDSSVSIEIRRKGAAGNGAGAVRRVEVTKAGQVRVN
jgi:prepilin-type N-terminal cleavage/methylation domain-containing protein